MNLPRLYFDWNSTTSPLPEAISAMCEVYTNTWGNPSSVHQEGRLARAKLDDARQAVAELVGGRAADVVFTSSATEASNIALRSPFAKEKNGALICAPLEHSSILSVVRALAQEGVELRRAQVLQSGHIDVDHVHALLSQGKVRLVVIQAVNSEIGVIQPVVEIASLAHRFGASVHVDVVQAVGRIPAPPKGWLNYADTVSIAAHKIRGPKGIGALVSQPGYPIHPVLLGGSQERGLRPGTQDAALATGFAVAAKAALSTEPIYAQIASHRDVFEHALCALGAAINGATPRVPHVINASFPNWSSAELVAALDLEGLAASGGSACQAGIPEPSSTLTAMWLHDPSEHWRFLGPIRFSLPPTITAQEIQRAISIVQHVCQRVS